MSGHANHISTTSIVIPATSRRCRASYARPDLLLVLLWPCPLFVTGVSCPLPVLTAWLGQPCSKNDMVGATMSFGLVRLVQEWRKGALVRARPAVVVLVVPESLMCLLRPMLMRFLRRSLPAPVASCAGTPTALMRFLRRARWSVPVSA
jgi:hypothetical protein